MLKRLHLQHGKWLQSQNLMKNLHKFYNKEDLPWVQLIWAKYYGNGKLPGVVKRGSLWWKSIVKLLNHFKGMAQAEAGLGDTILFCTEMWNGYYNSPTHTCSPLL
jgi:hypothetical protein